MAARWTSGSKLDAHARHCMGIRSLLCGDNGCELEVSLHLTHRLLNRDHNLFDRSGVAFSEAGHDRSIAIVGGRFNLHRP